MQPGMMGGDEGELQRAKRNNLANRRAGARFRVEGNGWL
jgi:hypothetical protein